MQSRVTEYTDIQKDAEWIYDVKKLFPAFQNGWKHHFHVTMVFVDDISSPNHKKLENELEPLLKDRAFSFSFAPKLGVFYSERTKCWNIQASVEKKDLPLDFTKLNDDIREKVRLCGGKVNFKDFWFHFTLGELPEKLNDKKEIEDKKEKILEKLNGIKVPQITVKFWNFHYIEHKH